MMKVSCATVVAVDHDPLGRMDFNRVDLVAGVGGELFVSAYDTRSDAFCCTRADSMSELAAFVRNHADAVVRVNGDVAVSLSSAVDGQVTDLLVSALDGFDASATYGS